MQQGLGEEKDRRGHLSFSLESLSVLADCSSSLGLFARVSSSLFSCFFTTPASPALGLEDVIQQISFYSTPIFYHLLEWYFFLLASAVLEALSLTKVFLSLLLLQHWCFACAFSIEQRREKKRRERVAGPTLMEHGARYILHPPCNMKHVRRTQ